MQNNGVEKTLRTILVCCGTGCLANNSMEIYRKLSEDIEKAGLNIAVKPYLKATGCNGLCEKGPLIKIMPDDITYCQVKAADVKEIINETILNGRIIDRLLILDTATGKRLKSHRDTNFYKKQHKLGLRNIGEIDPADIKDYLNNGGYKALKKVLFGMKPDDIITVIETSGLRGRGGAGFPTGSKWRSCAKADSFPKYVVCNGDEGDPGAFMDRSIMEGDPNSVIEGMAICAYALSSNNGFIYIRDEYSLAVQNLEKAMIEARKHNFLGNNILGSGFNFDIQIVRGGGAFVCGESTALMSSIEGNVGEPRIKYIRSTEKGLWDKPTVLNNVETWANIPEIINKGAEWFKSIGTENSTGTKVFSLVGKVKNTGLVEVPMGTTLRELIFDIGGGIKGDKKFKAVQTGGPSGGCIPEQYLDLQVDFDSLSEAGSIMGSGGIIVMDENTCMIDLARYYLNFLSDESCGKCVPCREGIKTMLNILNNITLGKGKPQDIDELLELAETISQTALCGLGKTAPNPVVTTIRYFKDEYLAHITDKKCPAGVCHELIEYAIDPDKCRGCGLCRKNCPVSAISGNIKETHLINNEKCIKCGNCLRICRSAAVRLI